jgi:hypothetical protein
MTDEQLGAWLRREILMTSEAEWLAEIINDGDSGGDGGLALGRGG